MKEINAGPNIKAGVHLHFSSVNDYTEYSLQSHDAWPDLITNLI